jgi:hypothetical protein
MYRTLQKGPLIEPILPLSFVLFTVPKTTCLRPTILEPLHYTIPSVVSLTTTNALNESYDGVSGPPN